MRRQRDRAARRLLIALAIALGVHLFVVAPGLQWLVVRPVTTPVRTGPTRPPKTRWVEVEMPPPDGGRDPKRIDAPIQVVEKKKEEPEREPPKPPPAERPDGQVVEIPPPEREERPDDAKLLSDYDSKVEKEQVHRNNQPPTPRVRQSDRVALSRGDDDQGDRADIRPVPDPGKRESSGAESESEREGTARRTNPQPGTPTPPEPEVAERPPEPRRPHLPEGGEYLSERDRAAERERQRLGQGAPEVAGGARGGPPSVQSLLPTLGPEEMARQDGSIDHVEDVDEGDGTLLNTRAYKYASFFNRVKNSVQQHWRAVDAHRLHDPYGRIYGVRDRITVLQVTLNADGTLDDIQIEKDSGVAFLDEVAVRAFRDAQPFPNPPPGLRDPDGRIRFRFGFHLEINGAGMRFRF